MRNLVIEEILMYTKKYTKQDLEKLSNVDLLELVIDVVIDYKMDW